MSEIFSSNIFFVLFLPFAFTCRKEKYVKVIYIFGMTLFSLVSGDDCEEEGVEKTIKFGVIFVPCKMLSLYLSGVCLLFLFAFFIVQQTSSTEK